MAGDVDRAISHDPTRVKVIACATVMEELAPRMPPEMPRQVLDFGLHVRPGSLAEALQAAVDASPGHDVVLLGYGRCSGAIIGLRATHCPLVIPRVDDCIALFLGGRDAYEAQVRGEPGTYYLTKGWMEAGDSPFDQGDRLAARYGAERAAWLIERMLRNYTRLAFIDTGPPDVERYRLRALDAAERYGLRFTEIKGSPTLIEKLLHGRWDREFVVVEQGDTVRFEAFIDDAPEPPEPPARIQRVHV